MQKTQQTMYLHHITKVHESSARCLISWVANEKNSTLLFGVGIQTNIKVPWIWMVKLRTVQWEVWTRRVTAYFLLHLSIQPWQGLLYTRCENRHHHGIAAWWYYSNLRLYNIFAKTSPFKFKEWSLRHRLINNRFIWLWGSRRFVWRITQFIKWISVHMFASVLHSLSDRNRLLSRPSEMRVNTTPKILSHRQR